nr:hypothetical protein HK105_008267 [Polyrhizophydium stewartii]
MLVEAVRDRAEPAAIDAAAAAGALDAVVLLHANGFPCSPRAIDAAAANGHLHVVSFLHVSRSEGCTLAAIDAAAANGHAGVVQFLSECRHEGCSTAAIDRAAANGHADVVLYLLDHRSEGFTLDAIARAATPELAALLGASLAMCKDATAPRAAAVLRAAGLSPKLLLPLDVSASAAQSGAAHVPPVAA